MSPEDQVAALEKAILERAQTLADEHSDQARRARERILADSAERLRLMEDREVLIAKARAEREYRRQVQASEIRMQAELDRMRWGLLQSVLDNLNHRLTEMFSDESRYLPVFKKLLTEAADSIERDELVALVGDADHRRLADRWETIVSEAVPNKKVVLSPEICPCSGGVLVKSKDERIAVDNTFEGRLSRFETELYQIMLERLLPSAQQMGTIFNG